MEVKVIKKREVGPVHPLFDQDHILPLSHHDNDLNAHVNFPYLRAYVNNPNTTTAAAASNPVQVITEALSKALVSFYPYAGVPVIHATADCTLASLNYLDGLAETYMDASSRSWSSLVFCLGSSIHHSMCDGYGTFVFFNAMVEFSRGATQPLVQFVWDRASLSFHLTVKRPGRWFESVSPLKTIAWSSLRLHGKRSQGPISPRLNV
ncbi:hypothetical protein NE237_002172 [Protea cynaroides]|uniref:Uncharacterized protein n=1 Tax=Protea cynaroides TaxID=273540 RepID=A0A9Q0KUR2_9MAGN|nr:hypothetical protein NE237_002172 [Protea cynaroides]